MADFRHLKQIEYGPKDTGISSAAINAAYSGSWLDVSGQNQLTVEVAYTNAAGTGFQFNVDTAKTNSNPTAIEKGWLLTGTDAGSGTLLYYRALHKIATTTSGTYTFDIPINCKYIRVANLLATGSPSASDIASVTVRLAPR